MYLDLRFLGDSKEVLKFSTSLQNPRDQPTNYHAPARAMKLSARKRRPVCTAAIPIEKGEDEQVNIPLMKSSLAKILAASMALGASEAHLPLKAYSVERAPEVRTEPFVHSSYILGPGDTLAIEIYNIPELSGTATIGPDGTVYLPRLRSLYVEGLTVGQLNHFLTDQYKEYIKNPEIYVTPVSYRPVRVYVGGEIERPGYYTLSSGTSDGQQIRFPSRNTESFRRPNQERDLISNGLVDEVSGDSPVVTSVNFRWPTLFDAIQAARGVTPHSNLTQVQVTRKQPVNSGDMKMRATINFMELVSSGNESVNIRLFDGDVVNIARSPQVLRDQLLAATRSNLSPNHVEVFVTGRVKEPGPQILPQGATLNQAIASAGGPRLLRGNVEFLRFNRDGTIDRRRFSHNPTAENNDFKNPVLMRGDIVRVNDSLFSATVGVVNELTGPAVGIYSVYSLFRP